MDDQRKETKVSPQLGTCLKLLRQALYGHIRIVDAVLDLLIRRKAARLSSGTEIGESVTRSLMPMMQAAGSSTHTLHGLSEQPGPETRDCFSIARSIVEGLINMSYIVAAGNDAAERAWRHAHQKAFRDMERESKVSPQTIRALFSGKPDVATVPGMKIMLDEFSNAKGQEKSLWIDLGVDKRLEEVGNRLGARVLTPLHFARFGVYRHSSEILHGTLFGAMFFMGATGPGSAPSSLDSLRERTGQQLMLLLLSVNLAMLGYFRALDKAYGLPTVAATSRWLLDQVFACDFFETGSELGEADPWHMAFDAGDS